MQHWTAISLLAKAAGDYLQTAIDSPPYTLRIATVLPPPCDPAHAAFAVAVAFFTARYAYPATRLGSVCRHPFTPALPLLNFTATLPTQALQPHCRLPTAVLDRKAPALRYRTCLSTACTISRAPTTTTACRSMPVYYSTVPGTAVYLVPAYYANRRFPTTAPVPW